MDKRLLMMATHMDDERMRPDMRKMPMEYKYPYREERVYNGYTEPYGRYSEMHEEPYERFSDSRGRQHYDNGRYAPMNRIGFRDEVRTNYETDVRNASDVGAKTPRMNGFAESNVSTMNYATAEEWLTRMRNVDGTTGPHWTFDQTKQVMMQKDIDCDPVQFWVAMNMIYSDYSKVAKQLNVNTVDFYSKMAKAFLEDGDAADDKLSNYYRYVVK